MGRLELPGWRIEYDPDTTRAAYATLQAGGAEACGCDPCRNWVLTRDRLVPQELKELLGRLGVPLDRDAEVYHIARLESGLHLYAGWYHFVGRVLTGELDGAESIAFGPFKVFFHSHPALLPEAFAGLPVVQLEFEAELPWLSGVPEPA